ncbi:MAG: FAD-dependent oxidoreductase [Vicinamibacterales bacterium]
MGESVYWYKDKTPPGEPLRGTATSDVVVVGCGMAGLTCAQALAARGIDVTVIERDFCGAGASGRSSGFITPDSELGLSDLVEKFGEMQGKSLWEFVKSGLERIRGTIAAHAIHCDFQIQDSLFVAHTARAYRKLVEREHHVQTSLGFQTTLYDRASLRAVVRSPGYHGGLRSGGTFGIDSYRYCRALTDALERQGVRIYESTPAIRFAHDGVETPSGSVRARAIAVFTDRDLPALGLAAPAVHAVRATLSISQPLDDDEIRIMFSGDSLMVWDTDLIYQYYRITGERRLLLGAGDVCSLYLQDADASRERIIRKQRRYLAAHFPSLNVAFEHTWSGLIGVSKDFAPVVGRHETLRNVYFSGAAAGLPWAAALGEYVSDKITDGRDELDGPLSPDRSFAHGIEKL